MTSVTPASDPGGLQGRCGNECGDSSFCIMSDIAARDIELCHSSEIYLGV
jgi:hypothetical protein